MRCLECWRTLDSDPLHIYCTGEHFVSLEEAQDIFDWLEGRYYFMINTGQVMSNG
jgi:hypothetical protein